MENIASIKLELGIDARKFIQQVQLQNEVIEKQITKGIELALNDITDSDNFVEAIRKNTRKELEMIVNKTVMSWEVKNKISKMVEDRVGKKIEEYADKIAEKITQNLI